MTPRKPKKKPDKESVKRAADRAAKRSVGEEPAEPKLDDPVLDPSIRADMERRETAKVLEREMAKFIPKDDDVDTTSEVTTESMRRGPKGKFRPEYVEQAKKIFTMGFTDEEAATFFEIDIRTFYRWMAKHEELRHAAKLGKDMPDDRVERALYSRAVGYTYSSRKWVKTGEGYAPVPYEMHVPPDPKACMDWLKNRRKHIWRDIQSHEIGKPGDFANLTDEELQQKLIEEVKAIGLPLLLEDKTKEL